MGLVLSHLILTVLFSLFITGICVLVLVWLPRAIYRRYNMMRPLPLAIYAFVIVVCLYESFCFVGAMRVQKFADLATHQIQTLASHTGTLPNTETSRFLAENYPILSNYIPSELSATPNSGMSHLDLIKQSIRTYIWSRIGWMIGLLILAGFLLVRDAAKQSKGNIIARNIYLDLD